MFLRSGRNKAQRKTHDLSDHDIILMYKNDRDTELIAVLFQRYTHLVYGVCLNYLNDPDDAKDAVMEIFEELIDKLLQHEVTNFKSWLHSVTRNHCLMKLRKEKTVTLKAVKMSEEIDKRFVETGDDLHQDSVMEIYTPEELVFVMKTLNEPQRKCIELVYLEDKSYQEVCEITGYSMHEVKSHVQNGKRNLKIRLVAKNER